MSTPQYSLLVVRFPGGGQEHPASSDFVINLMRAISGGAFPDINRANHLWIDDTPITMSRNRAVKFALAQKYDYLLMIDSDMQPDLYYDPHIPADLRKQGNHPPRFFTSSWEFLMDRRRVEIDRAAGKLTKYLDDETLEFNRTKQPPKPVPPATIAAPYCGPPPDEHCFIFEWKNTGDKEPVNFKLGMIPRDAAAVRSGIQECAALPTGLILYDLRLFESLPKPWFDYEYKDDEETEKDSTEDVVQTRNASMLGFPQFVNWNCWAGHVKRKIVGKPYIYTPQLISVKLKDAMKAMDRNATVRIRPSEPGPAETGPSTKIVAPLPAGVQDTPEVRERLQAACAVPAEKCDSPPDHWQCTREKGHEGPCAAVPKDPHDDPNFQAQVVDDPLAVTKADRYPAKRAVRYGAK